MKNKALKVGFDLDGVLLYNPARIFRPVIFFIKKYFLHRDTTKFYYPKNRLEKTIWYLLHKSSLWPAPGIDRLYQIAKKKKIKVYIISARYESLKTDFDSWVKKIDPDHLFAGYFYNNQNDQPHLYKEKIIKKLGLDIFVEDNWDIVKYLKTGMRTKIFWIYNLLDRQITYPDKFPSLRAVMDKLSQI